MNNVIKTSLNVRITFCVSPAHHSQAPPKIVLSGVGGQTGRQHPFREHRLQKETKVYITNVLLLTLVTLFSLFVGYISVYVYIWLYL